MHSARINQKSPAQTSALSAKYQRLGDVEQARVDGSHSRSQLAVQGNAVAEREGGTCLTKGFNWMKNNPGKTALVGVGVLGAAVVASGVAGASPFGSATGRSMLDSSANSVRSMLDKYAFARLNTANNVWEEGSVVNGTFQRGYNPIADEYRKQGGSLGDLGALAQAEESAAVINSTKAAENNVIGTRGKGNANVVNASAEDRSGIEVDGDAYFKYLQNGDTFVEFERRRQNETEVDLAGSSGAGKSQPNLDSNSFAEIAQNAAKSFAERYPNITLPQGLSPRETLSYLQQQGINPYELLNHIPQNVTV